jgi:hypothetical protein
MKRSTGRRIEYRWFIAGAACTPEQFWAELRRPGGKAIVETVDLAEPGHSPRDVPTPAGRTVLAQRRGGGRDA